LDGYHWNIANWGTKWDIYCDGITLEDTGWTEGCDSVTFDFETAWSPPVAWLQTAAARYPELSFKLHYEEAGCCFAGDILGEAGETTDIPYNDDQLRELFDWDAEEDA